MTFLSPTRGWCSADLGSQPLLCSCPTLYDLRAFPSILKWQPITIVPFPCRKPSGGSTSPTQPSPNSSYALHKIPGPSSTIHLAPTQTQGVHAACDSSLSLSCLFPPLSGKLLLRLDHPTSLSPLVSFLYPLKIRKPTSQDAPTPLFLSGSQTGVCLSITLGVC